MVKRVYLLLCSLAFLSCKSVEEFPYVKTPAGYNIRSNENKNSNIYKNGFERVEMIQVASFYGTDAPHIEELRFMYSAHSMYIKEGMFTRFGPWQDCIIREDPAHPALIWKKKLLPEHDIEFKVIADGEETRNYMYSCVQVLYDGKDALAKESPYRKELVIYFSKMITSSYDNPNFANYYYKHKCSN